MCTNFIECMNIIVIQDYFKSEDIIQIFRIDQTGAVVSFIFNCCIYRMLFPDELTSVNYSYPCLSYSLLHQSLVIANGGLGNGVSRCQLHSVVEECGQVESLLMPPNKPYSFVQYGRTAYSKQAYDSLNGKELILDNSSQKVVLYFNYVEKGITEEACFSILFFSTYCL